MGWYQRRVHGDSKKRRIREYQIMSSKPYSAFFKLEKDEKSPVESKMPKPLEEYFPKKKTVKILVRQHDRTLKLRKMQRTVRQLLQSKVVKPKYSLRDPTKLRTVKKSNQGKRKSSDKAERDETKRSRSSIDFDDVVNVETTKSADVPMTHAQHRTA